jgi:hypothetical protein
VLGVCVLWLAGGEGIHKGGEGFVSTSINKIQEWKFWNNKNHFGGQ